MCHYFTLNYFISFIHKLKALYSFPSYSGSPSHPSMMGGPMPVRGPAQGPRGTGAGMRGQMGRGDYG